MCLCKCVGGFALCKRASNCPLGHSDHTTIQLTPLHCEAEQSIIFCQNNINCMMKQSTITKTKAKAKTKKDKDNPIAS